MGFIKEQLIQNKHYQSEIQQMLKKSFDLFITLKHELSPQLEMGLLLQTATANEIKRMVLQKVLSCFIMLQKGLPNVSTGIKNDARLAGDMAQWLRTLAALIEERGSASSTPMVARNHP